MEMSQDSCIYISSMYNYIIFCVVLVTSPALIISSSLSKGTGEAQCMVKLHPLIDGKGRTVAAGLTPRKVHDNLRDIPIGARNTLRVYLHRTMYTRRQLQWR